MLYTHFCTRIACSILYINTSDSLPVSDPLLSMSYWALLVMMVSGTACMQSSGLARLKTEDVL